MHDSPSAPSPTLLRVVAAIGAFLWLARFEWSAGQRPDVEWLSALVAGGLGVGVAMLAVPRGVGAVLRHKDLLVPFGCLQAYTLTLSYLPLPPFHLNILAPMSIFDAGLLAVAAALLQLLGYGVYLVWQTLLVVQVATSDGLDLSGELRHALRLTWRGVGVVVLSFVGTMAPLVIGVTLHFPLELLVVGILVWSLAWSMLTFVWLPLAFDEHVPFLASLGMATRAGIDLWRRWFGRVLMWALAMGVATFHSWRVGGRRSQNWNVNAEWLGGYPTDSNWYFKLCDVAEVPALGGFAVPLTLLFLTIAIAFRIEVVRTLEHEVPAETESGE